MPGGRVRCWKGPQVWTHRGEVHQLRRPHFAQAKACPKKKAARSEAEGWRSSSPKWSQPAQAGQPEEPPTSAEGENGGEMEVEEVWHESGSGEEMEE